MAEIRPFAHSPVQISPHYSLCLGIALAWTVLFSMFSAPGIRGYRNLGWVACYAILVVMLFRVPFVVTLTTWGVFGFAGGILSFLYEVVAQFRSPPGVEPPPVSLSTIFHGFVAWPIMVPEAIEYTAAEFGLLKAPPGPRAQANADREPEPKDSAGT